MRLRRFLRRPAVKCAVAVMGAVAGMHLLSAVTLDRHLQYKEIVYRSEKIPASLDGYTIAFLSDIHHYPANALQEVVAHINHRGAQLLLLGGDMPPKESLDACMDVLAGVHASDGIFGVEGNHDNAARLRGAMEKQNMVLLENSGLKLCEGFYLAGVEDLWNRGASVSDAVAGALPEDFVLLVAHNPDVTMQQDMSKVDLVLSGHTHGGELSLFGLWRPALPLVSRYGQRFGSGWCKGEGGTDVFVSHGVGGHSPLRVFVRPQVIYLTLYHQ